MKPAWAIDDFTLFQTALAQKLVQFLAEEFSIITCSVNP